jgi:energy-coupling factor transporter ATP-binding protein EcfA2
MEHFSHKLVQSAVKGGSFLHFSLAIVGPSGSGKSTFLHILLGQIAEKVAGLEGWRKTFFYLFDFHAAKEHLTDMNKLYGFVVDTTFRQLGDQDLRLQPHSRKMSQYFQGLPSRAVPARFPNRITIDSEIPFVDIQLSKIAAQITELTKPEADPVQFVRFIFQFPLTISRLFGLTEIHYTIDHFEESDVEIYKEEWKVPVSLIEEIKYVLKNMSFIICCKDLPQFLEVLSALTEDGTDLNTRVTFANIADIRPHLKHSHSDLVFHYEKPESTLILKREQCGGCIAFLAEWNDLLRLARSIYEMAQKEAKKEGKPYTEACSEQMILIDRAKAFLPKLLTPDQLPKGQVKLVEYTRYGKQRKPKVVDPDC